MNDFRTLQDTERPFAHSRRHGSEIRSVARGIILVHAAAAILALASCARPSGDGAAAGRKVTDLAGREVSVPGKIERLVALGPGALRLVAYLGAVDRIVGIEDFERRMAHDPYVRPYASTLDEEFLSRPVVGTGGPGTLPDPEKILTCRPDLIVAVAIDPAQMDNIQTKTGVPAIYLSYGELGVWREEARRSLSLLGEVLGVTDRAAALNGYVTSLEGDLRKRTADEKNRPSAYFGGISYKGSHGIDSTEGGYPPARMAGARNVADDLGKKGHFFVDREQILVWNPDFIFVDAGSRLILDRDFGKNREFYRLLKASRSGRVYSLLPYNYYNTNIELALLNAYFVGKTLYPDRFEDVDIAAKAGEIMETFLGTRPDTAASAYRALRFPETGPAEWD
jgi:iron complex transport system substrate-binding protein